MTAAHEASDAGPDQDAAAPSVLARRAQRFEAALRARIASTVVDLPFGVATLAPDLPRVYVASGVEVTRTAAVAEVLGGVDAAFTAAGLRHRRISTTIPEVAWNLAPALADRGWDTERLVMMVHDGITEPPVSPLGFAVVDHDRYAPVGRRVVAAAEWGRDPEVQDQRGRYDARLAERIGARFVMSTDGMAGCHVYRHSQVAQIESVNVLPEARGQGLGQGLMAAAMGTCDGAGLIFLAADADDWVQTWYRRLGFVPVAAGWDWILPPPAQAGGGAPPPSADG